jgi:hypothetical protein
MKATQLFLFVFFLISIPFVTNGQDKPKLQYTIGLGSTLDRTNTLWGVNFSNELNVNLRKRTSLNLGLSFYQSLYSASTLLPDGENKDQSSGLFISPTLKFDILQRPSGFKLAFAFGPSLQFGGDTYLASFYTGVPAPSYVINKYQRLGLITELEAEWKTKKPNVKNAASISAFGADKTFPWYVNLTYKVRFGLGKN